MLTRGDTIRAVVFDVDGTLYRHGPVRRAMIRRLVRAHWAHPSTGVRVSRLLAAYRHAQEALRSSQFEGDVASEQLAFAADRCGVDPSEVEACVAQWMEAAPLDVVAASARAGLIDALDALAARGIKLAALSDYPADRKLEALGIANRFAVVLSAQDPRVRAFKPNPRGLLVALAELQVACSEALYVGDRSDVDAAAAAAANVRCLLVGGGRGHRRDTRYVEVGQLCTLLDGMASP